MHSFSLNCLETDLELQSNYFTLKGLRALSITGDCLLSVEPQSPFINISTMLCFLSCNE